MRAARVGVGFRRGWPPPPWSREQLPPSAWPREQLPPLPEIQPGPPRSAFPRQPPPPLPGPRERLFPSLRPRERLLPPLRLQAWLTPALRAAAPSFPHHSLSWDFSLRLPAKAGLCVWSIKMAAQKRAARGESAMPHNIFEGRLLLGHLLGN